MTPDGAEPRYWEDVADGQALDPVEFPLTVYRLVVTAGANRDFNAIHHNAEYARASGAPDMYANTTMLLGMWERAIRQFIGPRGRIRAIKGFSMTSFNPAGVTVTVQGRVRRAWLEDGDGRVELEVWCENGETTSVGPGTVVVSLPRKG